MDSRGRLSLREGGCPYVRGLSLYLEDELGYDGHDDHDQSDSVADQASFVDLLLFLHGSLLPKAYPRLKKGAMGKKWRVVGVPGCEIHKEGRETPWDVPHRGPSHCAQHEKSSNFAAAVAAVALAAAFVAEPGSAAPADVAPHLARSASSSPGRARRHS